MSSIGIEEDWANIGVFVASNESLVAGLVGNNAIFAFNGVEIIAGSSLGNVLDDTRVIVQNALDDGVDEFERAGLQKSEAKLIDAPMVADSPVNLECKLHDILDMPAPGNAHWIIGEVVAVHIKDDVIEGDFLHTAAWKPVARLGYKEYAIIDNVFDLDRPKNV